MFQLKFQNNIMVNSISVITYHQKVFYVIQESNTLVLNMPIRNEATWLNSLFEFQILSQENFSGTSTCEVQSNNFFQSNLRIVSLVSIMNLDFFEEIFPIFRVSY